MSANVAVIFCDSSAELRAIAEVFGEAAIHLGARVRLLRVPGGGSLDGVPEYPDASLAELEWADAIALGTPTPSDGPPSALMRFIESSRPLWESGRLSDKVVTIFTDEPERPEPDAVLHPIYNALYHWGAVIVGPRDYELRVDARFGEREHPDRHGLPGSRVHTAQYRARRLTALASVIVSERDRRSRLEL
jgi:NAD(P)H dehydrogenase (quinone)